MKTFTCTECNQQYTKWIPRCNCGAFTLIPTNQEPMYPVSIETDEGYTRARYRSQLLSEVKPETHKRISTGIEQFDNVLSGGFVPGSVTLIGGDPGIGKSTLILQSLELVDSKSNVLYVSGEESLNQIAQRARRVVLHLNTLRLTQDTTINSIFNIVKQSNINFVVVDSIQTISDTSIPTAPGSLAQVKRCAIEISKYAKAHGVTFVIVCHVSKDGLFAGPKALEHFVDTVLYFQGEPDNDKRLLRVTKNRYGSTNKFGVFTMTEHGLIGEN